MNDIGWSFTGRFFVTIGIAIGALYWGDAIKDSNMHAGIRIISMVGVFALAAVFAVGIWEEFNGKE